MQNCPTVNSLGFGIKKYSRKITALLCKILAADAKCSGKGKRALMG